MTQSKARVASDGRAGVFAVSREDREFRKLVATMSFLNFVCKSALCRLPNVRTQIPSHPGGELVKSNSGTDKKKSHILFIYFIFVFFFRDRVSP